MTSRERRRPSGERRNVESGTQDFGGRNASHTLLEDGNACAMHRERNTYFSFLAMQGSLVHQLGFRDASEHP